MKRPVQYLPLLFALLFFLPACQQDSNAGREDAGLLDRVVGMYQGTVPCADCEGIRVRLKLQDDYQYQASFMYLGKSDEAIVEKGKFGFIKDSIVSLNRSREGFQYYQITGADLKLLDLNRAPIHGPLEDHYVLSRTTESPQKSQVSQETEPEGPDVDWLREKWEEGLDFHATGTEPFWSLSLDFEKSMTFKPMEGDPFITPPAEPTPAGDDGSYSYRAETEAGMLKVTIIPGECINQMSGKASQFAVEISLKRGTGEMESYSGCGSYIANPRLHDIWVLKRIGNESLDAKQYTKGLPTLELFVAENRVVGHDGCNEFTGSFYSYGNVMSVGPLASTMKACPDGKAEEKLTKHLTGQPMVYGFEDSALVLTSEDGERLEFQHVD